MFCALGPIFSGTEDVGSRFHVLRPRTRFRRYRGRQVPFSCFALPDSFLTVPRASGPVFLFCPPEIIFGGTEGVKSHFYVFSSRRCFQRYRGCLVPFSCFALLESFSTVPRASGPVFLFCVPGLIFGGTEGVESCFHVLHSLTRFQRYRGRWVLFSCFALPDLFSVVPTATRSVFMFFATGHVFGGTEGVGSRFHVLCAQNRFRWYRGRRDPFSCFTLPNSFSAVPRAFLPFFLFSAPGNVFGDTERVGSLFYIFRSRTCFWR
jgi:hypothetical protein